MNFCSLISNYSGTSFLIIRKLNISRTTKKIPCSIFMLLIVSYLNAQHYINAPPMLINLFIFLVSTGLSRSLKMAFVP